jgi:hypothetical protein
LTPCLYFLEAPCDIAATQELVDEKTPRTFLCPAHKHNKVGMPELAQNQDFILEASNSRIISKGGKVDDLHGCIGAIRHLGTKNSSCAALSQATRCVKPFRCLLQHCVRVLQAHVAELDAYIFALCIPTTLASARLGATTTTTTLCSTVFGLGVVPQPHQPT